MGCSINQKVKKDTFPWNVHDMNRTQPKIINAGSEPGDPPSDAIVLFDGKDASAWCDSKGNAIRWKVENGYMEINKTGSIRTKEPYGSCQLHIEWAAPAAAKGKGQHRGNSGVFFMSKYEVQVLDSFDNKTYPDGQAASLYGQYPPAVNACRKPGEWQCYDIIFHRPTFNEKGEVEKKALVTLFHNGVLVQDHVEMLGVTTHGRWARYGAHPDQLPLMLQEHGSPIRYRNIWIRPLADRK